MKALLHREGYDDIAAITPNPPRHKFYLPTADDYDDLEYEVWVFRLAGVQDGWAHYAFEGTSVV